MSHGVASGRMSRRAYPDLAALLRRGHWASSEGHIGPIGIAIINHGIAPNHFENWLMNLFAPARPRRFSGYTSAATMPARQS